MYKKHKYSIVILLLLVTTTLKAQYIQVDNTYTAQQLVDALISNSCSEVSNITVTSGSGTGDQISYAYFNSASSNFPFVNGILLSTGYARKARGPNNAEINLGDGSSTWRGDRDLENAVDINNTYNSTTLEFDFRPLASTISFDYMLASEEYLQQVELPVYCDFSDGFAFLLKPAGSLDPYLNLAVIPNTNIPVKVTTVRGAGDCPQANPQYFGGYNGFQNATAFNGQTTVLTASASVTPGVLYHIKLVIADQGDTLFDSAIFLGGGSFKFDIDLGPDRLLSNNNPVCANNNSPLIATPGGDSYKWFKDNVEQPVATNAFNPTGPGDYRVEATFSGCVYNGEIKLEYSPAINVAPVTFNQCDDDNDGLTAYYLTQITNDFFTNPALTVSGYYTTEADAENNANPIPVITPFFNTVINQVVYAKLQNIYGCSAIVPVTLTANTFNNPTLPAYELCETHGILSAIADFDLQQKSTEILQNYPAGTTLRFYGSYNDALSLQSPLPDMYANITPLGETIYARLNSNQGCYGIIPLQLAVHTFTGDFTNRDAIVCENSTITMDAGEGYTTYSWDVNPTPVLDRFLTIREPGTYTVTVTNSFGCEATKTFNVTASGPAQTAKFEINDFAGNINSVTVTITQGVGTYQYSIDGGTFQDSPVFNSVETGRHIIYIRDINGCGPVYQKVLYVLDYPRMFSPNGDNIHDTWFIPYMYTRPNITAIIFNRYGKVITGFTGASSGWDGTLNGSPLPADDYWFTLQLENGTIIKGHFALIR